MSDQHQKRAIRGRIDGAVQGVGFRYRCKWQAENLNLDGWVRNNSDGSVTLHLQGMGYRIDAFQGWLRGGVQGLMISRLECQAAEPEDLDGFEIRY